jgi:catechol 2,3-dioxygenase-like lactoylglutathione lyase family enzyme
MAEELGFDGGLTCALECADLDRSIQWYETVLGFTQLYRVDEIAWCELQSAVANVNIGLSQVESPQVRGGATLTFGVSDIAKTRGLLEARGVEFDGDTVVYPSMVSLATFYDPDGNKLMLYRDLSEAGQ